jgi:hypothetical protein
MKGLSHNLHYVTFMPLILIGVLSSVNLLLAAAVCTGLVACIILLSYCCFRRGYVKVSATQGGVLDTSTAQLLVTAAALCAMLGSIREIADMPNSNSTVSIQQPSHAAGACHVACNPTTNKLYPAMPNTHNLSALQVFPKPFDIFNLCLYGSMIFLAAFAHDWLATYMSLLTNAGNAAFMWVSDLGP